MSDFKCNPSSKHPAFEMVLDKYFSEIKSGPTYICNCCNRYMYRTAVLQFKKENFKGIDSNLFTEHISEGGKWLCVTCKRYLNSGQVPAQSLGNHLQLVPIPEQLASLCHLERQLISRIIPFMKIMALPKGGQHGLRGQVVLVPAKVQETANILPRQTSESQIVALSLKRRLSDKHSVSKQYIRPQYINNALSYLQRHNPHYKDIVTNQNWTSTNETENPELWNAVKEPSDALAMGTNGSGINSSQEKRNEISNGTRAKSPAPNQADDTGSVLDSEDEVEEDNPEIVRTELELRRTINSSTCLYPKEGPTVTTNEILHLAPGEGQRPTSIYHEKNWEAMAFPTLFPVGINTHNAERQKKLTVRKYINARLLSADGRFAENTEYIFQCLHWAETIDIKNSITMQLKKTRPGDINARKLRNPEYVVSLMKEDELFASFKKIRGSPQYWKEMQQDMIAKIRQFGPYTFFISGSAADFHWPELIQVIAKQYGEHYTLEDAKLMNWQTKRNWLARNPVTAARHIDYIFQKTWKTVILSGLHPIGQILNYDIRKEMQSRGTEHFHSALHVLGAPILDQDSDEDVIAFIDKTITCAIPDQATDEELRELVKSRQTHHHTRTCKKRKGIECRFHLKKNPSTKTLIARQNTSDDILTKSKHIMNKVMEALEKAQPETQLSQLLDEVNISNSDYEDALSVSRKRASIVLKRKPFEASINPYNPYILKALRSNMDIQYITDVWACIAYITSYMCKPEREMSELMRNAVKEADTVSDKLKSIGNTFLQCREVSEHEAIVRLLGLPLRESSTTVQYVPTNYEGERTRMLKAKSEIEKLDDDDENVYMSGILDKYAARPEQLSNI